MKLRNTWRVLAGIGASLALVTAFSGTAEARPGAPWIGYGYSTSGPGVKCAQMFAGLYGNVGHPVAKDGRYGPETQDAIKRFQVQAGKWPYYIQLTADGIVGPATGKAMLKFAKEDYSLEPADYVSCSIELPS
ncbi:MULTISPECIES: peptidoglycan-binding domain-containing protein [unclassified Streptomyces]|uniref:peptidoglycan-binding domain-containing protein n=1 Tax=unclassified Streptomyces TaxID=2593676 RepID=UPI003666985C